MCEFTAVRRATTALMKPMRIEGARVALEEEMARQREV
jgi:hypothetical protein